MDAPYCVGGRPRPDEQRMWVCPRSACRRVRRPLSTTSWRSCGRAPHNDLSAGSGLHHDLLDHSLQTAHVLRTLHPTTSSPGGRTRPRHRSHAAATPAMRSMPRWRPDSCGRCSGQDRRGWCGSMSRPKRYLVTTDPHYRESSTRGASSVWRTREERCRAPKPWTSKASALRRRTFAAPGRRGGQDSGLLRAWARHMAPGIAVAQFCRPWGYRREVSG